MSISRRSVFLSYSHEDSRLVANIQERLIKGGSKGFDCFRDLESIRFNEAFMPKLQAEIDGRETFVLFWSESAQRSDWVAKEIKFAEKKRRVCVLLDESPPPFPFEDLACPRFPRARKGTPAFEHGVRQIRRAINGENTSSCFSST